MGSNTSSHAILWVAGAIGRGVIARMPAHFFETIRDASAPSRRRRTCGLYNIGRIFSSDVHALSSAPDYATFPVPIANGSSSSSRLSGSRGGGRHVVRARPGDRPSSILACGG